MKNPVGFLCHQAWGLPAWKILKAEIREEGLWIEGYISETEEEAWTLIKEGILRALSIGFRIKKSELDEDTEIRTIKDLELLEISLVGIPANPETLIQQARSKGLNFKSLDKYLKITTEKKGDMTFEYDDENKNLTVGEPTKEEFDEMEAKEVMDKIGLLENKIDSIPKGLTEEEAKKTITDINKAIDELKDSNTGLVKTSDLEDLKTKSKDDLLEAMKTLEKKMEETWVKPPKIEHDFSSIGQAKRLGNLEGLDNPVNFKMALIGTDVEKAAAQLGMMDNKHLLKELQEASDDLLIVGAYMKMVGGTPEGAVWNRSPQRLKTYKRYMALVAEFQKAMDTGTSGEGSDWLPTGMSSQLAETLRIERTLGKLLPRFPQPMKSYVWPLRTSGATAYIVSEATADSAANVFALTTPGTSSITFTAKGMGAGIVTSDEETEDSIIPILPFIRTELARALADGEENALINGDDATTHQDTDVAALGASDIRKIFDGLRFDALANASGDASGTLTYALMISTLKKAGKYSVPKEKGFWLAGIDSYYKMMALSEFTGYNVFAQMAVAGKGELPLAIGHPVVISAYMRNDLGPVGVNAASDNVHTALMFVCPSGYMIGDRQIYTVESDRLVMTSQSVLVAKQRIDFKKMKPSTDTTSSILYNITTA